MKQLASKLARVLRVVVVGSLLTTSMPVHAETIFVSTSDGPREAIVLPVAARGAATIIVLHGATVTAAQTILSSGFAEAAAAHGFVAVFPQGLHRQWNDGREKGPVAEVDDVGFIRALIDDLVQRQMAQRDRVFIAGISNGGMMAFRLLCEEANLFAGAVTIIASMPAPTGAHCRLARAVPLLMFNGTSDPLVPYAGGRVGFRGMRGEVWSAEGTAKFFASHAGCRRTREMEMPAQTPGDLHVSRLEWGMCASPAGVALFRVNGGGHQVPGGATLLPRLLGLNVAELNAADIALRLFARGLHEPQP